MVCVNELQVGKITEGSQVIKKNKETRTRRLQRKLGNVVHVMIFYFQRVHSGERKPCRRVSGTACRDSPKKETKRRLAGFNMLTTVSRCWDIACDHRPCSEYSTRNCSEGRREGVRSNIRSESGIAATRLAKPGSVKDYRRSTREHVIVADNFHCEGVSKKKSVERELDNHPHHERWVRTEHGRK